MGLFSNSMTKDDWSEFALKLGTNLVFGKMRDKVFKIAKEKQLVSKTKKVVKEGKTDVVLGSFFILAFAVTRNFIKKFK